MTRARLSIIVVTGLTAIIAAGQEPSQPPRFRVAVDVVSIDAVVTDSKGDVVPDLSAADFEVFQGGKRQKVTFAQFVPVITVAAPVTTAIGSSAIPAPPATEASRAAVPPARDQVGRTFVLVVDDLGLSVVGMNNTRRALREVVATGLLPTDLVAIVRTGESRGMMQSLTNDYLGHESVAMTQIYIDADLEVKERALARTAPPGIRRGRFRPSDPLLAYLSTL